MKYTPGNTHLESHCTTPITLVETEAGDSGAADQTEQHVSYPNIDRVTVSPDTLTVNHTSLAISRREATLLYMLCSYAKLRGMDDPVYFRADKLLTGLHCGDDIEAVYKVVNRIRTRLANAKLNRNLIDGRRGHGYRVSTRPSNITTVGFGKLKLNGTENRE